MNSKKQTLSEWEPPSQNNISSPIKLCDLYPIYFNFNFKNEALYQFRLSETPKFSTIQKTKFGDFTGYYQEKWAENTEWILEPAPYFTFPPLNILPKNPEGSCVDTYLAMKFLQDS